MDCNYRKPLYQFIETELDTKLIVFITGTRPNAETQIGNDCIDYIADILDECGEVNRITLLIHTLGGDLDAAWRLTNLIKMYCREFNIIIPSIAMSAGTLIALGANRIIMPNRAVLGPIDPSIFHEFGPPIKVGDNEAVQYVSAEDLYGFVHFMKNDLNISGENALGSILAGLSTQLHPLTIGNIYRVRAQIQELARNLLESHSQPNREIKKIIDVLCTKSGSHVHTINRNAATHLGLKVEQPNSPLLATINKIRNSYNAQMQLSIPFNPFTEVWLNNFDIRNVKSEVSTDNSMLIEENYEYTVTRSLIESVNSDSYGFQSIGEVRVTGDNFEEAKLVKLFDGWVKY